MGCVRVIAGTMTVRYGRFSLINVAKSTKIQRNKQITHNNSAFGCKFVCASATFNLKRVPGQLFSVSLIKFNRALSGI